MVAPAMYEEEEQTASSIVEDDDILKPDYDSDEITPESLHAKGVRGGFEDFIRVGFAPLPEDTVQHSRIAKQFRDGLGKRAAGDDAVTVTAVHRNLISWPTARARFISFRIHEKAVADKCGGVSNARFAWYGGSKDEICKILSFGFSRCTGGGGGWNGQQVTHGVGVHLSPIAFPADCLETATVDQHGTKHLLLCRVILGKMEAIPAGSSQSTPSSVQFDSGVDDLANPRRFVVWSSFMNSHIFPVCVVSFRDPGNGIESIREAPPLGDGSRRPRSPWMSFPALLSVLSEVLDRPAKLMISKSYDDFKRQRITREQLVRKLRQLVGDELLASVIKSKELTIGCNRRP